MTLHREPAGDWREVSIVCALPMGRFLVQEADRPLPGRFAALRTDLREVVGTMKMECLRDFVATGEIRGGRGAQ